MQMISSRTILFLDDQTLAPGTAREALFRDECCGFILYLSDDLAEPRDRIIRLGAREALIWLDRISQGDEPPSDQGLSMQLPQAGSQNDILTT